MFTATDRYAIGFAVWDIRRSRLSYFNVYLIGIIKELYMIILPFCGIITSRRKPKPCAASLRMSERTLNHSETVIAVLD